MRELAMDESDQPQLDIDPQEDRAEVHAIRREMEEIRRAIEALEHSPVRAPSGNGRAGTTFSSMTRTRLTTSANTRPPRIASRSE
jgi:hypothetical protein